MIVFLSAATGILSKYATVNTHLIGVDADSREYCLCEKRTTIEMQTFANDIDSVFTCCACGKPIALYELPYLEKQEDHWCIVNWQRMYGAVDELWLDSLSDRFTSNQLINPNSALNKSGRAMAEEIGRKSNLKCYYNIFDDLTTKIKFINIEEKPIRICPSCGKAMKYVEFREDYKRYVCEDCSLTSDIPKDNSF